MRILGISLLIVGFLWIAAESAFSFLQYQHARWIWQSQHLPAGEMIQRTEAVNAMRALSLALNDRQRVVFIPALLMLVGGLTVAFTRKTQRHETPTA